MDIHTRCAVPGLGMGLSRWDLWLGSIRCKYLIRFQGYNSYTAQVVPGFETELGVKISMDIVLPTLEPMDLKGYG